MSSNERLSTNNGWNVIYIKSRHERKVSEALAEKGVRHFYPIAKKMRQWKDRRKIVEFPLFPSYIFVSLSNASQYFDIVKIDSVLFFLKSGKKIAQLSETTITNIQKVTQFSPDLEMSSESLAPGKRVIIKEGVLAGVCGEVVEIMGKAKLLVRVNLLQRNLLLNLSISQMLPVEKVFVI